MCYSPGAPEYALKNALLTHTLAPITLVLAVDLK
jgi:hypothetical protein